MMDQSQYQPPEAPDPTASVPGRNWQLFSQRLSLVCALVAMAMLAIFHSKNQWFLVPGTLSIGVICWTFLVRAVPIVLKIKTSVVGGAFFLLFNAHFTIVGLILAKSLISNALRLPAEDFPITTSVLVVWDVIAIWMIVGGLFLAPVSSLGPVTSATSLLARLLAPFLESSKKRPPSVMVVNARSAASWANRLGYNVLGASITSVALVIGGGLILQVFPSSVIRVLAFAADYENAPDYPGVGNNKIRLHNNGIVSVATCSDWNVSIEVRTYDAAAIVPPLSSLPAGKQAAKPATAKLIQTGASLPAPSDFIEQCRAKDSIWTSAHFFAWLNRL